MKIDATAGTLRCFAPCPLGHLTGGGINQGVEMIIPLRLTLRHFVPCPSGHLTGGYMASPSATLKFAPLSLCKEIKA